MVVNSAGKVVYDELLEHTWPIDGAAIEIRSAPESSHDVIVIAPGSNGERAFIVRTAA